MTGQSRQDIRWQQRYANYQRALSQLAEAVALSRERKLSRLEQQGLIQAFEFTQELAWQVMKDYFEYQGNPSITGSRDAIRAAFGAGLVLDGEGWMDTISSRNRSTHAYDENTANELAVLIADRYLTLFQAFNERMQSFVQKSGIFAPMDRFGLPENVFARINAVLGDYPSIERAVIYVSRAKRQLQAGFRHRPCSDRPKDYRSGAARAGRSPR